MSLPTTITNKIAFKLPTKEKFEETRLSEKTKSKVWFKGTNLTKKVKLPLIMPIQAFLVIDPIDGDIDLLIIYKRWHHIKDILKETEGLQELSSAITSFLITTITSQDNLIKLKQLKQSVFVQSPLPLAQQWKKNCLLQFLPSVTQASSTVLEAATNNLVNKLKSIPVEKEEGKSKCQCSKRQNKRRGEC